MGEDLFRKKITENYPFFVSACIAYAAFFIVCLYKNGSGITFPVWTAGTSFFAVLMMKKADIDIKKGSFFYIAAICLLGVSTCLTGDTRIICMNKWLIFFLMLMLLLTNFYDVSKWNPAKFIANMFCTVFISLGCIPRPFSDRVIYKRDTEAGEPKENNTRAACECGRNFCRTAEKNNSRYILLGNSRRFAPNEFYRLQHIYHCVYVVFVARKKGIFRGAREQSGLGAAYRHNDYGGAFACVYNFLLDSGEVSFCGRHKQGVAARGGYLQHICQNGIFPASFCQRNQYRACYGGHLLLP